jgi:hypothetical protein
MESGIRPIARANFADATIDGRMQIGWPSAEMPPIADMNLLRRLHRRDI